ncbi:unnamed protein product [Citrullus colocynthis]|uniref:Uncharacterized protein n=1 Tax=Citrullus colocynthis TaxID=252529 RepID=A0ABP0XW45_9ROSI
MQIHFFFFKFRIKKVFNFPFRTLITCISILPFLLSTHHTRYRRLSRRPLHSHQLAALHGPILKGENPSVFFSLVPPHTLAFVLVCRRRSPPIATVSQFPPHKAKLKVSEGCLVS